MKASLVWIGLLVAGFGVTSAAAQGTAVQLPSYSYFTTNSSVLVPDRGSAYLGGVNRARSGMNEFGTPIAPLRNRSLGSERSASGASVSAFVHDFEAMDEMLLGPDFRKRGVVAGSPDPATLSTEGLQKRGGDLRSAVSAGSGDPRRALDPRRAGAASADTSLPSAAEIRAQRRRDQEVRQAEAQDYFDRGQTAEEAGKMNVARIYYQMAARRAGGSLKTLILARLDSMQPSATAKVARKE